MLKKLSTNQALLILGVLSFCALGIALIAQYGFKLAPCQFCLYERYPYSILVILSLLTLWKAVPPTLIRVLMIITILGAIGVTTYHIAVEHKWVDPPASCTSDLEINKTTTVADLKAQILAQPRVTRCDIVPIKILGLSMAEYNLLFNIFLLAIVSIFIRKHTT